MHVCVLGGGIIGVTTAYYLARDGHQVTVLERREGAGLETSFANGAQLSYSYVAPLADPTVPPYLPGWLLKKDSPLRFRPQLDPHQWLWCLSFLRACTRSASQLASAQLLALGYYSRSLVHELMARETLDCDYVRNGKLVVYRDPKGLEGAKRQMEFQAALGSEQQALDGPACLNLEPALESIAGRLAGGIYTPSEDAADCYKLSVELARLAGDRHGAKFLYGHDITRLRREGKRIVAAQTTHGEIEADAFVVSLAIGSRELLLPLDISLPLYPLKGYSLTLPIGPHHVAPRVSVTDVHHKVVYAKLGDRLRIAGIADITGMSATPDPGRVDLLTRNALETFPNAGDYSRPETWLGLRPATPNSKPILGPTPYGNLWLNTGHGALGFTLACGSGQILADCIAHRPPAIDASIFALN